MPGLDRTGPAGKGPMTGRGLGRGAGKGQGLGRGQGGQVKKGLGGSDECECPKCGHVEPHKRGVPCTEVKCPKCSTPLRGTFCK